jgi:hypothetical protein
MSTSRWSADPTHTLWENVPPPTDDDGTWGRGGIVNIFYAVPKKILTKHVSDPQQPWGTVIPVEELAALRAAAAAGLPDERLRRHLDVLLSRLEPLVRLGIGRDGLIVAYDYAMDGPGWTSRLEPRWLIALPVGLRIAIGLHDREKELRTAFFPDGIGRRHPAERLRALARDLLQTFACYRDGCWAWPALHEVRRVPHPDGGVEVRTRIRPLAVDRWQPYLA